MSTAFESGHIPGMVGDRPPHTMVSIRSSKAQRSSGAGVLLGAGMALTCAHVVNDALNREHFAQETPGDSEVVVDLPRHAYGQSGTARVDVWIPPVAGDGGPVAADLDDFWLGDLAVLRLTAPAAESAPPPPVYAPMRSGQRVRAWHGSGALSTFADAMVKTCDDAIAFMDGYPTGLAIGPGYSGGPLCHLDTGDVVGLVAAHFMPNPGQPYHPQQMTRRSWVIPWQRIEKDLRMAGVQLISHETGPRTAHEHDHGYHALVTALERFLPYGYRRQDIAQSVAKSCKVAMGARVAGSEDLAGFLLDHPRAVAALSVKLHSADPAAARAVLEAGRMSSVPLLLAPTEHDQLLRLIDELGEPAAPLLAKSAAAALPLLDLPAAPGARPLLEHLETLPGDSRSDENGIRVPALLRATEFLATAVSAVQQSGLRLWADAVAQRLFIPPGALQERRSDAKEWAARKRPEPGERPRLLIQVRSTGPDRWRIRIWSDRGNGPQPVAVPGGQPMASSQAALHIRRVLESPALSRLDGPPPLVTTLVDRAGLNTPVDAWSAAEPDDLVPAVLGAEYPVTVHCPELIERSKRFVPAWRSRWKQIDDGQALTLSGRTLSKTAAYGQLLENPEAVRVTVDLPASVRDDVVVLCMSMGVPVVVWDRERGVDVPVDHERDEGTPGSRALDHLDTVPTHELPDGVRAYRAKQLSRPAEHPGQPVVGWADAERPLPRLHLAEPEESER
ncbi:trypsin-like peptidase domain-containing protein [Streptomyces fractus]|uniref:VMAP-C domain-containing protein n=1 Tax=Streptomyces fractus TaxID=641806 RepID=UPI003CF0030D